MRAQRKLFRSRNRLPRISHEIKQVTVVCDHRRGHRRVFCFHLKQYFSIEYFKSQRAAIDAYVMVNPLQAGAIFFSIYVAVTGLSLPGAAVTTPAGGAIFGLLWDEMLVSLA